MALGSNLATTPGTDSHHRVTIGNPSNKYLQDKWRNLIKLHTFSSLGSTKGGISKLILTDRTGTQVAVETYIRFNEKKKTTSFLKPQGPTALVFGLWKWLMVLYIHCGIHAPGVKFGHVDNLHRLTTGKHSSINNSKVSRWIICKLHTHHHLTVGNVAYCLWSDLTETLDAMAT